MCVKNFDSPKELTISSFLECPLHSKNRMISQLPKASENLLLLTLLFMYTKRNIIKSLNYKEIVRNNLHSALRHSSISWMIGG